MATHVDSAEQAARTVKNSRAVEVLARLGLASRGLVWLVLGLLAVSLVRGGEAQADQTGALKALVDKPFGGTLLVVLAIGFAGYAAWLLLEAGVSREEALHRVKSGLKGVVYAALCISTVQFLARGSGGESASSRTADLMGHTGGRTAVGVIGLVLLGLGGYFALRGVRRKHAECLEDYRVPDRLRTPAIWIGAVGYVGRGVTLGLVGAFLVKAAVQFDPKQAKGLDAALQAVAEQPYGRILLGLTVIGVLAYALWSFFEAAFRDF
ncbi:MAG: putative integral rane protein [Frankiales bacterium]|jgi:hypothetical protein|nr:putative integral rane protein [Frankiales bacterium]